MSEPFLITGRSLKNWRERGKTPPADAIVCACLSCNDLVTISPEGGAQLAEAKRRGDAPAGALCTPCVLAISMMAGPRIDIRTTKAGADLVEEREEAKAVLDFMIDQGAKP